MQISKRTLFWTCLIIVLTVLINTLNAGRTVTAQEISTFPYDNADCQPGSGWRWVPGDEQPGLAEQVQRELSDKGISAVVQAKNYGEADSCGTFFVRGVDLTVTLSDSWLDTHTLTPELTEAMRSVLTSHATQGHGTVKVVTEAGIDISEAIIDMNSSFSLLTENTGSWNKVMTGTSPQSRYLHGLAYDTNRDLAVLFGGDDNDVDWFNDTWTFDGKNWTQVSTTQMPEGRVNIDHGMVYDALRDRVVLFGGLNNSLDYLNDTWEFDGFNWFESTSATLPPARDSQAMAYDSFRGKTIMFGGYSETSLLNDTWVYDGSWKNAAPYNSPSNRYHHALAYDSHRHVTILFGGMGSSERLGDTWEYDGYSWRQVFPAQSPPARENHSMAYDSMRGVVVLFGGEGDGGLYNDLWEYDGSTWVQVTTSQSPPARIGSSIIYNTQSGKMVLFGGGYWNSGTLNVFNDTWEYQNGAAIVLPDNKISKKVYVISYNPVFSNGQTLGQYYSWTNHAYLTQSTIDFFKRSSKGLINYRVVDTTIVDGWPRKVDGFTYTEATYKAAMSGSKPWHTPDNVDYNEILLSSQFDICGRVNRGEIDEVWIYNGPGFGFYESTLAGPGAYWLNSPPVTGSNACNKMVTIMGPSPERDTNCAVENFGHRTESTMTKVYKSWEQNRISHSWEKFALVKALSPSYTYSGCGNIHYPPNGVADYDYANSSTVKSNCDDFANYPNLSNPLTVAKPVTCTLWGCDHLDYFNYWFGHLPDNTGCGTDDVANNWWKYFANPKLALNPQSACNLTEITKTFTSNATYDGYILESSESSEKGGSKNYTATTIRLGDDAERKQLRAVLSFNTASIPDTAEITKVSIKIKKAYITGGGNPFTIFQGLRINVKKGYFGSLPGLQLIDFQAAGGKVVGPFTPEIKSGWYIIELPATIYPYINKLSAENSGITQLRLGFTLGDNGDNTANTLSFFSGNSVTGTDRPALIVKYKIP